MVPEATFSLLVRVVAGLVGGLQDGAGSAFGKGIGFSKPSRPRVGGADSALVMGAGLISVPPARAVGAMVVISR